VNKKLVIAVPLIAGVLAISTGVGVAFAKNADQAATQANYAAAPAGNPGTSNQVGYCGGYGGRMAWNGGLISQQVADLLGTTVADLQSQLDSGKTLAELAAAKGVSQDQLLQTMLAFFDDQMTLMQKYGYLDQDQITSMTEQMKTRLQAVINGQAADYSNGMWDYMDDMMGGNGYGYGMMGGWGNRTQLQPGTPQPNSGGNPQLDAPNAPLGGFGGMGYGGMMNWR
jgi:hypothetical protein